MANKDHTLDSGIMTSAREEFLEKGFAKASLREISKKAGITTGALYTRYENKDRLFESLIEDTLKSMQEKFPQINDKYMTVKKSKKVEDFLSAIESEVNMYLELLSSHYEDCILMFCKNNGSAFEVKMNEMMREKARQTVEFLKEISKNEKDLDFIELIFLEQFDVYKHALNMNLGKEKTISSLKSIQEFNEAGWKKLFENIL